MRQGLGQPMREVRSRTVHQVRCSGLGWARTPMEEGQFQQGHKMLVCGAHDGIAASLLWGEGGQDLPNQFWRIRGVGSKGRRGNRGSWVTGLAGRSPQKRDK